MSSLFILKFSVEKIEQSNQDFIDVSIAKQTTNAIVTRFNFAYFSYSLEFQLPNNKKFKCFSIKKFGLSTQSIRLYLYFSILLKNTKIHTKPNIHSTM